MKVFLLLFTLLISQALADDPSTGEDLGPESNDDFSPGFEGTTEAVPTSDDFEQMFEVESLRLVSVLYRHGDRSQVSSYANDLYQESDFPQGYGQLSREGMEQEFMLGRYLHQRYIESGFLNSDYQRNEVYVRSTAYDRTLMSAYSVLAALFPPDEDQSWKDGLPWQPIPVHTVSVNEDFLLHMNFTCPVYTKAESEYRLRSPIINETLKNYENEYVYISDNSGEESTWEGVYKVLDPIFCQNASGYVLPDWVTPQIMDTIVELRDIYSYASAPPNYAYLRGGPLVGEILDHMVNVSAQDKTSIPMRLFMYSAHDSTLIRVLMTLGVFNYRNPPYSACLMVELHEVQPNDFSVLLLYKNETDVDPYVLKLPSCDIYCPLEKFAQIMQPNIPKDLDKECQSPEQQGIRHQISIIITSLKTSDIVAIVLGSVFALILFVSLFCCIKIRCSEVKHEYVPVPMEMH